MTLAKSVPNVLSRYLRVFFPNLSRGWTARRAEVSYLLKCYFILMLILVVFLNFIGDFEG